MFISTMIRSINELAVKNVLTVLISCNCLPFY
jgi:hypothetical protein